MTRTGSARRRGNRETKKNRPEPVYTATDAAPTGSPAPGGAGSRGGRREPGVGGRGAAPLRNFRLPVGGGASRRCFRSRGTETGTAPSARASGFRRLPEAPSRGAEVPARRRFRLPGDAGFAVFFPNRKLRRLRSRLRRRQSPRGPGKRASGADRKQPQFAEPPLPGSHATSDPPEVP